MKLEFEYLGKFKGEFKPVLGYETGAQWSLLMEKQEVKIS
jgi:hypothetical protein